MLIGKVIKENVLVIMTFDEDKVEQLCQDMHDILHAAYYFNENKVTMFGHPWLNELGDSDE